MHELMEINGLYWMYIHIYKYIYTGIMICSLHIYLCIRFKIFTGSLLLKHTMFSNDILSLYDFCMTFVHFYAIYIWNNIGTA